MIKRKFVQFFLCLYCVAAASNGAAATIVVTDFEDVNFGDLPPTSQTVRQRVSLCVSATPAGPYRITGVGLPTGQFELLNGAGEAIPYAVYASRGRGRLGRELTPASPLPRFFARRPHPNGLCRPPRLWLTVLVDETELQQASGGEYGGTLQLTVSPE